MKRILFVLLLVPGVAAASGHAPWDRLLARFVSESGVDYTAWKSDPRAQAELDVYLGSSAALRPSEMPTEEALAYWINLYNALTVDLVLDHHPIASIKDIGGPLRSPWKLERIEVEGRRLSLDAIEHAILRRHFDEPRIHFALNCASVGCPPLARSAFEADSLEVQLERVTRRTLGDPRWVDPSGCPGAYGEGRLRLTKLFDWFADDFGGESGVREFLARYRPADALVLRNSGCRIEFADYDWSLNDSGR